MDFKTELERLKLVRRLRDETIIQRVEVGERVSSIADDYGLTRARVYDIINEWKRRHADKQPVVYAEKGE